MFFLFALCYLSCYVIDSCDCMLGATTLYDICDRSNIQFLVILRFSIIDSYKKKISMAVGESAASRWEDVEVRHP